MTGYSSGFGLPQDVLFDLGRAQRLFSNKWFFAGTRGDVPEPKSFLKFSLFDEEYFLLHGTDGVIRCMVNRCAHQSARLLRAATGKCPASIVCPNHQWTYNINDGALRAAPNMEPGYPHSDDGRTRSLTHIPLVEVDGLLFGCLAANPDAAELQDIEAVIAPYIRPFALNQGGYKLAHHASEIIDGSWLLVMVNNRECCHCRMNHKGLLRLFDPSSFNGTRTPRYDALLQNAIRRWQALGLAWEEKAFAPNDCCRVARYPLQEQYQSITFDGQPACRKLIGPFSDYDQGTLSMWFNPNAWVHFASDHIATNWVLPLTADTCALHSSWIVRDDAVEGEDYALDHLTEVWKVTNGEDVALCNSMTSGARSNHYRPGPFSADERFCAQFCDWYMNYSSQET